MAEAKTEQEPSIEEILESIRQIISEDGESQPKEAAPQPPAAPPVEKPAPALTLVATEEKKDESSLVLQGQEESDDDDILDLTEVVEKPQETHVEIDLREIAETPSQGETVLMADQADQNTEALDSTLLSEAAASASTEAMAKLLSVNLAVEQDEPARIGRVTLEDIARELMRPIIKSWLDQNLPKVIEKVVSKEVEKLSRRAQDK